MKKRGFQSDTAVCGATSEAKPVTMSGVHGVGKNAKAGFG